MKNKFKNLFFILALLLLAGCASIQQEKDTAEKPLFLEPPKLVTEGDKEILLLDQMSDPANWIVKAGAAVDKSDLTCPVDEKAVKMHVELEKKTKEFPRIRYTLGELEYDWSQWDQFEFMALARSSREKLPPSGVEILIGKNKRTYEKEVPFPEKDKWRKVTIDIKSIGHKIKIDDIDIIVFSITPEMYKVKDTADFYLGGFRLIRAKKEEGK